MKLEDVIHGKGESKGFLFTKEHETDQGYVYKVDTGTSQHYEVFYKRSTPVCLDFENRVYSKTETKELYPKSKDFGKTAWTYYDRNKAIKRLIHG